jgi:DNA repair exonuclease SbcCD ATPase subunit
MKANKLTIENIGMIEKEVIPINNSLIIFYGEIRQGKTTILNAVRWVLGGGFPEDIIRHGQQSASIQLEAVQDGKPVVIRREWYIGKDGTVKAREIQYTISGQVQQKPVQKLQAFLNPFMLDQNHFANMNELARSRYLVDLFGVDTSEEDSAIAEAAREAQELRAKIKGYGEIDLTQVPETDTESLKKQLADRRAKHAESVNVARQELAALQKDYNANVAVIDKQAEAVRTHNAKVARLNAENREEQSEIDELQARIARLNQSIEVRSTWLIDNPAQTEPARPAPLETSAIDARINAIADTADLETAINAATANEVRREQYVKNVARAEARDADNKKVLDLDRKKDRLRDAKIAKLKSVNETCGVPGLEFNECGSFTFEGSTPGMISTSQSMRLSEYLSALYPEGFSLSLIDRGESLGKSVFDLVDRAKKDDKTILVTVVGEKPAVTPVDVGVFVVENGKLS